MKAATRTLATLMQNQALAAGAADPSVRGADWRVTTVATINGDGTVTTTDGIIARCLASYLAPAAADTIVISESSAGSWLALGPLATAPPQWTPYTATWAGLSALGASTSASRYQRGSATVNVVNALTWGTGSSLGTGTITVSLPTPASSAPTGNLAWYGTGRHTGNDGTTWKELRVRVTPGATTATVYGLRSSDIGWQTPGQAGYTWGTAGANMAVQFAYEI